MTTATAKNQNYTEEQTAFMVEAYTANPTKATVEMLAEKLGKGVKSIVAKLARQGVYQKTEYKTKTGETPTSKEELVEKIASLMGCPSDELGGLEKANKTTLVRLVAALG